MTHNQFQCVSMVALEPHFILTSKGFGAKVGPTYTYTPTCNDSLSLSETIENIPAEAEYDNEISFSLGENNSCTLKSASEPFYPVNNEELFISFFAGSSPDEDNTGDFELYRGLPKLFTCYPFDISNEQSVTIRCKELAYQYSKRNEIKLELRHFQNEDVLKHLKSTTALSLRCALQSNNVRNLLNPELAFPLFDHFVENHSSRGHTGIRLGKTPFEFEMNLGDDLRSRCTLTKLGSSRLELAPDTWQKMQLKFSIKQHGAPYINTNCKERGEHENYLWFDLTEKLRVVVSFQPLSELLLWNEALVAPLATSAFTLNQLPSHLAFQGFSKAVHSLHTEKGSYNTEAGTLFEVSTNLSQIKELPGFKGDRKLIGVAAESIGKHVFSETKKAVRKTLSVYYKQHDKELPLQIAFPFMNDSHSGMLTSEQSVYATMLGIKAFAEDKSDAFGTIMLGGLSNLPKDLRVSYKEAFCNISDKIRRKVIADRPQDVTRIFNVNNFVQEVWDIDAGLRNTLNFGINVVNILEHYATINLYETRNRLKNHIESFVKSPKGNQIEEIIREAQKGENPLIDPNKEMTEFHIFALDQYLTREYPKNEALKIVFAE